MYSLKCNRPACKNFTVQLSARTLLVKQRDISMLLVLFGTSYIVYKELVPIPNSDICQRDAMGSTVSETGIHQQKNNVNGNEIKI
jgi:hypothetical protein